MSPFPKGEMLGHSLVWDFSTAESLDTDFHKAQGLLQLREIWFSCKQLHPPC